jgi:hypothetical protein
MRGLLFAVWLVLLVGSGCRTVRRAEGVQQRERELYEVNRDLDPRQQVTPRTTREMFDPLLMEPQQGPRPTRP